MSGHSRRPRLLRVITPLKVSGPATHVPRWSPAGCPRSPALGFPGRDASGRVIRLDRASPHGRIANSDDQRVLNRPDFGGDEAANRDDARCSGQSRARGTYASEVGYGSWTA